MAIVKFHYYKFSTTTELGKAFIKLWNQCNKAEKAADKFAANVGAITYYPTDSAFAGGVACVAFKDNICPKPNLWKSIGKDADGFEQWVPNVKKRMCELALPNANVKPSDAANRIYNKQPILKSSGQIVLPYVELYRDDIQVNRKHPERKLPYYVRESIRIEKARMKLPEVSVISILTLLQADITNGKDNNGKLNIIKPVTPTFFQYSKQIYVGCAYPCKANGLTEISMGDYVEMEKDVRAMMRDLEIMKS